MIHDLTPRVYGKGMKWSLLPDNKIRTVNLEPALGFMSNIPEDVSPSQGEPKFTVAEIGGVSINLADTELVNSKASEAIHWSKNTTQSTANITTTTDHDLAKGRIEILMGRGSRTFSFSNPIQGTPSVALSFAGKSVEIPRGEGSFDSMPSMDQLISDTFNLVQWVQEHATEQNDSLLWNYSTDNNQVAFAPWLSGFDLRASTFENTDRCYVVAESNVATKWLPDSGNYAVEPNPINWRSSCSVLDKEPVFVTSELHASDRINLMSYRMAIIEAYVPCECKLFKIDDYTLKVEWQAPIRVAYCASSRVRDTFNYVETDNWAFLDNVTDVTVSFTGLQFNTEKNKLSYGLRNGELNDLPTGEYPYTLDAEELFAHNYVDNQFIGTTRLVYRAETLYEYTSKGKTEHGYYYFNVDAIPNPGAMCAITLYVGGQPRRVLTTSTLWTGTRIGFKCNENLDRLFVQEQESMDNYFGISNVDSYPYAEPLAEGILQTYYNGKYVIECTVPAKWAIANAIGVGSQMHVYDQSNRLVKRDGVTCVFEVKNVEKQFRPDSFIYYLQLLEE